MWSDYPDIHTAFGCNLQRRLHRLIKNKIRSGYPDISLCIVYYLEVGIFCNGIAIERTIIEGLYETIILALDCRKELVQGVPLLCQTIPVTKEHQGKVPTGRTCKPYGIIFPIPELHYIVGVFVCQVHSTCVTYISIDIEDLPMVPEVQSRIQVDLYLIEGYCFYAIALQCLLISTGKNVYGAHIVKYHSDVHPLLNLYLKFIQYPVPPLTLVNYEILHENELPGLLYVFQQIGEEVCSPVKVFDFSVFPNTETCNILYILALFLKGMGEPT